MTKPFAGYAVAGALLTAVLGAGSALAESTLIDAAKANDTTEALALIEAGADPNAAEADGTTPLLYATHTGNVELVRALLQAGADAAATNSYGAVPMQEAAALGDAEIITLLLDAGADAESPNREGQTALMAVARAGGTDAALTLLRAGANPNARESWGGQTALMWAVAQRQTDMIRLLIDQGAEVDMQATVRDWDRHVTAEPRIKELFSAGLTALLYAARDGCLDCAEMLIDAGADIDKPDPDGITPVMMALLNSEFDVAAYLVEAGASPNVWDWWGRTPLYAAADLNITPTGGRNEFPPVTEHTGLDVARMLLERGADPNLRLKLIPPERAMVADRVLDDHVINVGATPLIRAAYSADVAMVRLLLEHGADATIRSGHGVSAIFAAAADGGTRGGGKTDADVIACIDMLIAAGADVMWTDREGRTPLHMAVRTDRREVVPALVERGADLFAQDDEGRLPMGYATGEADWIAFGTSDVVGVLPEMVAVLEALIAEHGGAEREG